jgi:hypothetical protein
MFAKPFQKTGLPAPSPVPVAIDLPFPSWILSSKSSGRLEMLWVNTSITF